MIAGEFGEEGEEGGRLDIGGGDAHQPGDGDAGGAGGGEEGRHLGDRATAFLGFGADVDLDERIGPFVLGLHCLGEGGEERQAIEAVDGVEQRDRFGGLVGLKLADEVEAEAGGVCAEVRPFCLGFGDAILAEAAVAGSDQRRDVGGSPGLADCDQFNPGGGAPGGGSGAGDRCLDGGETFGSGRFGGVDQKAKLVPK